MSGTIEPIARMINQLSKLPGVGAKTAQRLAYHIISLPEEQVRELAVAIFNGKKQVKFCSVCGTPVSAASDFTPPQPMPAPSANIPYQQQMQAESPDVKQKKKGGHGWIIGLVCGLLAAVLVGVVVFFVTRSFVSNISESLGETGILEELEALEEDLDSALNSEIDLDFVEEYLDPEISETYDSTDLGFSMPVPDGWTTEVVETEIGTIVDFSAPNGVTNIFVQVLPSYTVDDFIGNEQTIAENAAASANCSNVSVSEEMSWTTLSSYDAYNFYYLFSASEDLSDSHSYDSYVIENPNGGCYCVQMYFYNSSDTDFDYEKDYQEMYEAYYAMESFTIK